MSSSEPTRSSTRTWMTMRSLPELPRASSGATIQRSDAASARLRHFRPHSSRGGQVFRPGGSHAGALAKAVPTTNSIGTGKDSRWRDQERRHAAPRAPAARCWPCLGRPRSGVDTPRPTTPGGGELSMAPRATVRRRDVRSDDAAHRGARPARWRPRSAVAPPWGRVHP